MEYDYNSRRKYAEEKKAAWQKSHPLKQKMLSRELKALVDEIICLGESSGCDMEKCFAFYDKHECRESFSEFMRKHCAGLVELFVPEKLIPDYYAIIDEIPSYPYSRGYNRRTVRTKNKRTHIAMVFRLLYSYMAFGTYNVSVADFVQDKMEAEALDFKRHSNYYGTLYIGAFDVIVAAQINAGNEETISAVKEAFLSENNTVIVTAELIRAVVKSKNSELHELLAKFLVAARLQEGIRQAVCENADSGTVEAFLTIIKYIQRENLLRFAGVKRAVSTWTGICDETNMDRISDKIFSGICQAVINPSIAKDMIRTDDSIQVIVGLWALGFYEIMDAISEMQRIAREGTKNQLLTISYYNIMLQNGDLTRKVSAAIFEQHSDDMELMAAFMPTYMGKTGAYVRNSFVPKDGKPYYSDDAEFIYKKVPVKYLFDSEEQARRHYNILSQTLGKIKKKKMVFSPCIFPWYSVTLEKSDFVERMSLIAYSLEDQALIDEVCRMLADIDGTYADRKMHIRMLLHAPKTEIQKKALISYVADKETYSREVAYSILKTINLDEEDYEQLEGYLKYKNEAIRQHVLALLNKQDESGRRNTIRRLVSSPVGNMRIAGLDMVKSYCEKMPEKKSEYEEFIKGIIPDEGDLTEQEKVLYMEIVGSGGASSVLMAEGYGLYDPMAKIDLPVGKSNVRLVSDYFSVTEKELDAMISGMLDILASHERDEYKDWHGETRLLGNGLYRTSTDYSLPVYDCYPFKELWHDMYKKIIKTPENLWNIYVAIHSGYGEEELSDYSEYIRNEKALFGVCNSSYKIKHAKYAGTPYRPHGDITTILSIIISMENLKLPRELCVNVALYAAELPDNKRWYEPREPEKTSYLYYSFNKDNKKSFAKSQKLLLFINRISNWKNDDEFKESFAILHNLDESYQFQKKTWTPNYSRREQYNFLSMYSYIKACELGMISKDSVYKYAFDILGLPKALSQLKDFMGEKLYPNFLRTLKYYMPVDEEEKTADREHPYFLLGREFYKNIVDKVLAVELKRGDSPTIFSNAIGNINCVYGLERLLAILTALGKDTLDRNTYYYWGGTGTGKKECLSHLLQVCYPLNDDNVDKLAAGIKKYKITEDRLIETAMYAPQWLDMVEEYLACDGFKSCCYYFMAHMNERFDDKKKAMIAKYTPLTEEELNAGCFDVDWFNEAYNMLGEKMFTKLYKAAKYISDGSKHTRARKYADAALGKVTREELETAISDKRNKDLLMSYGIIPLEDEADQLHRYEFLQRFLKESRQFGAQRRASESKCVEVALKNMATVAGYADDLRLVLAMETALVTSNSQYFDGMPLHGGEFTCRVSVNIQGKAELSISKGDKKLKTVPAALKKDEDYLAVKEFVSKLKNQYSRCVKMFEAAMEEREVYTFGELKKLTLNPVTREILCKLLFVICDDADSDDMPGSDSTDDNIDITLLDTLLDGDVKDTLKLRIAHTFDLYKSGEWDKWQRHFFAMQQETGARQPFKQVFRELYVKLSEENDQVVSRMFAGNQIQTGKTIGALKSRRWVADYENGLQKIYYKDNIIATIYAMADWFSPADVEEPTLEYVAFYDRKTFRELKISEVPDIIYSEVMRDTDLAVSVAHAGGVDPVTTHSTIEMRTVIFKFNVELFKLDNVTFEGSHAFIKGKYGEYSVHLGSGVIHMVGGHQLNVLPVHSQNRGKIFLPFIDDDPKTAEIMSKILLFAQDNKIKDPYIMEQIHM